MSIIIFCTVKVSKNSFINLVGHHHRKGAPSTPNGSPSTQNGSNYNAIGAPSRQKEHHPHKNVGHHPHKI